MHRVRARPRRPETAFQVRPVELGHLDYPGVVATIRIRRRPDRITVVVDAGEDRWSFDGEDGLVEGDGDEPIWMAAVLDYAGMTLANRGEN